MIEVDKIVNVLKYWYRQKCPDALVDCYLSWTINYWTILDSNMKVYWEVNFYNIADSKNYIVVEFEKLDFVGNSSRLITEAFE